MILRNKSILDKLLFRIRAVKNAKENKYILLNAPLEALHDICKILPGMKSPTILPLEEKGWCSIHSVVKEDEFWERIDQLKNAGAEGNSCNTNRKNDTVMKIILLPGQRKPGITLCTRPQIDRSGLEELSADILRKVKKSETKRFLISLKNLMASELKNLRVSASEIAESADKVPEALREAINSCKSKY